jgi:hypothetical protein
MYDLVAAVVVAVELETRILLALREVSQLAVTQLKISRVRLEGPAHLLVAAQGGQRVIVQTRVMARHGDQVV